MLKLKSLMSLSCTRLLLDVIVVKLGKSSLGDRECIGPRKVHVLQAEHSGHYKLPNYCWLVLCLNMVNHS